MRSRSFIESGGVYFAGPISGQVAIGDNNQMTQYQVQHMEDRSVKIGGSASGSIITTGDGNATQLESGVSKEEYLELLHEMQLLLLRSGLNPEEQEVIKKI